MTDNRAALGLIALMRATNPRAWDAAMYGLHTPPSKERAVTKAPRPDTVSEYERVVPAHLRKQAQDLGVPCRQPERARASMAADLRCLRRAGDPLAPYETTRKRAVHARRGALAYATGAFLLYFEAGLPLVALLGTILGVASLPYFIVNALQWFRTDIETRQWPPPATVREDSLVWRAQVHVLEQIEAAFERDAAARKAPRVQLATAILYSDADVTLDDFKEDTDNYQNQPVLIVADTSQGDP